MEHFSIIVKLFVIMGLTWSDMFHFLGIKLVGSGSISLGINYSVLNEMKRYELWLNTEDFRLENYSFNTGNICSMIGQIVTEFFNI